MILLAIINYYTQVESAIILTYFDMNYEFLAHVKVNHHTNTLVSHLFCNIIPNRGT